ncbi:hypothetical protein [Gordonia sp. (in: high G+C Gram-positive bacteria)]|uniref:hypothetical protein n=1 Tax=Gordonia sp. (in: high G+C Gram-positive bacteria) TaxID=84139 RepID=UPI0039E6BBA0
MSLNDIDNALSGGKSVFNKESQPGEEYTAPVIDAELKQATDPDTGNPAVFKSGDPKMQIVIRLRFGDDDIRTLYIKTWGKQRDRFNDAIAKAGAKKASEVLKPGTLVRAKYLGPREGQGGPSGSYTYKDYEYEFTLGGAIDSALDSATAAFGGSATPVAAAPAPAGEPDLSVCPPKANPQVWAGMSDEQKRGFLAAVG